MSSVDFGVVTNVILFFAHTVHIHNDTKVYNDRELNKLYNDRGLNNLCSFCPSPWAKSNSKYFCRISGLIYLSTKG